jgi:hypothetical protein
MGNNLLINLMIIYGVFNIFKKNTLKKIEGWLFLLTCIGINLLIRIS